MTSKKQNDAQVAYGNMWRELQAACKSHGNTSTEAKTIRDQMDYTWANMLAEDRNGFYYGSWEETRETRATTEGDS